jgi:hypothetical protein
MGEDPCIQHIALLVHFYSKGAGLKAKGNLFYLWRKVDCFVLFCNYKMHQTGMLQIMFGVSLQSSRWGGVHRHLMFVWTCSAKVLEFEYWMISSLNLKRFGFRMWEILILKWFLPPATMTIMVCCPDNNLMDSHQHIPCFLLEGQLPLIRKGQVLWEYVIKGTFCVDFYWAIPWGKWGLCIHLGYNTLTLEIACILMDNNVGNFYALKMYIKYLSWLG